MIAKSRLLPSSSRKYSDENDTRRANSEVAIRELKLLLAGWNCGSEENARHYAEFSTAMKAIDSSIKLIATGNPFDFVEPGPHWSFVTADGIARGY